MKSDTMASYLAKTEKYKNWHRIDQAISTRLAVNTFIENYKKIKNQKRRIYTSMEDIDLARCESKIDLII